MYNMLFQKWLKRFHFTSSSEDIKTVSNDVDTNNQKAFHAQQRRVIVAIIVLVMVLVSSFMVLRRDDPYVKEKKEETNVSPEFSSPNQENVREYAVLKLQQKVSDAATVKKTLATDILALKHRQEETEEMLNTTQAWLQALQREKEDDHTGDSATTPAIDPDPMPLFRTVTTRLTPVESTLRPDVIVPAGSYVTAVLLSGVDVSAGVSAVSDPKPVLLRTIKPISLPHGKIIDIQNCRIVGASFGEVSSERAYIRLERMSCFVYGTWVDLPVFGYVAGTDGKAGVRGKVVMRDKAMLSRAFLGGLISGLGDTISNQLTTTHINPLGSTVSIEAKDSLAYGAGTGMNTAATHMADYYIKRAEQYQPVIQVMAGTIVDVVFHQGFSLTGTPEGKLNHTAQEKRAPLATLFEESKDNDFFTRAFNHEVNTGGNDNDK